MDWFPVRLAQATAQAQPEPAPALDLILTYAEVRMYAYVEEPIMSADRPARAER